MSSSDSRTGLRTDTMRIELHALGFDQPLIFDQADTDNDSITIRRLAMSDDAGTIAVLTANRRRESNIKLQPLNTDAEPIGRALFYYGSLSIQQHYCSNHSDLAYLVVRMEQARLLAEPF